MEASMNAGLSWEDAHCRSLVMSIRKSLRLGKFCHPHLLVRLHDLKHWSLSKNVSYLCLKSVAFLLTPLVQRVLVSTLGINLKKIN